MRKLVKILNNIGIDICLASFIGDISLLIIRFTFNKILPVLLTIKIYFFIGLSNFYFIFLDSLIIKNG